MKSKYKLGTLVQYTHTDGTLSAAIVEGIVTRKNGFSYFVQDSAIEVLEEQVTAAFRAVKPRQVRKVLKKSRTRSHSDERSNSATAS